MEEVLLQIDNGVATITLNRPDKLNSFTGQMHVRLRAALDRIEADASVRAVLLTGAGRGFCAGQDLPDLQDSGRTMLEVLEQDYAPLVLRLQALPLPVIAAVNGVAAGAGANLALACDLTLAARSASFIQAFVKIGLIPDCGGTWFLPHRLGLQRAMGLAMLGDKLGAEQAEQWGLIWKCVDDAALLDEAGKLARHLATQPTRALAAIKQQLRGATTRTLEAQLPLEVAAQAALDASHDYQEGVRAFIEKRTPKFKGC